MAAIYPLGQNRIFYRSSFKVGISPPFQVIVELIEDNPDPELIGVTEIELTNVGPKVPGLFYFEAFFSEEGTYMAIFYEVQDEGDLRIEKATQSFSTRRIPATTIGGFRPSLGDNVINA